MNDIHHYRRRAHAIRRLAERYGLFITTDEYETFARAAQSAPQFKGTNIVVTDLKGVPVYCTIQRGEVSTFLTPEQARFTIHCAKSERRVETSSMGKLGDLL